MDPTRMLFAQVERPLIEDENNEGLNCKGCLFYKQKHAVCKTAAVEAVKRQMRDCDAVDQFGDVVIYVTTATDPRQLDLIGDFA
jgi:hypothetical protein